MKNKKLISQSKNTDNGKSVKIGINGNGSILLIDNRDDIEFYFNEFQELFEKHCSGSTIQYHQCDCDWIDEVIEDGEYYKFNHNKNTTKVTYCNREVEEIEVYFNKYTHQEVLDFMLDLDFMVELTMKLGDYSNIKWMFNTPQMIGKSTFSIHLTSEDIIYKKH